MTMHFTIACSCGRACVQGANQQDAETRAFIVDYRKVDNRWTCPQCLRDKNRVKLTCRCGATFSSLPGQSFSDMMDAAHALGWRGERTVGHAWTCPICNEASMKKNSLRDRVDSNMSVIAKSLRFLSRDGLHETEKREAVDAALDALNALDGVPIEVIQYASQAVPDPHVVGNIELPPNALRQQDVGMFPSMPIVYSPPTLTCAPLIEDGTTVVLDVRVRGLPSTKRVVVEGVTGLSAQIESDAQRFGYVGVFGQGRTGSVTFTTDVANFGPFQVPAEHAAATLLVLAVLHKTLLARR